MRKILLYVFLYALSATVCLPSDSLALSWPFGGVSKELREVAKNQYTTPSDIRRLIKAGADVNDASYLGFTALMEAAQNSRYPEVIDTLIQAGAEVNAKDKTGWTALMWAAQHNKNVKVIQALIDAGADVEAHDDSKNVLSLAAEYNTLEAVKALLMAGADVNAKSKGGETALMYAAVNKNPEVVRALIRAGADVNARNKDGVTALMNAAHLWNTNPEVARVLINAGADVNAVTGEGLSALTNAAGYDSDGEKIKILLKAGAEITPNVINNLKRNSNPKLKNAADFFEYLSDSNSAISRALQYNITPEIISTLVEFGAKINGKDKDGRTALMNAARLRKKPKIIKALIEAGANIYETDSIFFGKSAKDYADEKTRHVIDVIEYLGKNINISLLEAILYKYNPDIISALLEFEEDKEQLTSALMFAAQVTIFPRVITLIVNAGADINAKDEKGKTALMYAAGGNNSTAVVKALIAAGADTSIKDSFFFGKTAKDYAKDNPNPEVLKIFEGL